jgi:hypothetical protein
LAEPGCFFEAVPGLVPCTTRHGLDQARRFLGIQVLPGRTPPWIDTSKGPVVPAEIDCCIPNIAPLFCFRIDFI